MKTEAAAIFEDARETFAEAVVEVRHLGRTWRALGGGDTVGMEMVLGGHVRTVAGGARLLASEVAAPRPVAGDAIEVRAYGEDSFGGALVLRIAPDRTGATLRLEYGA